MTAVRLVRAGREDREVLFRLLQYSLYEESACDGNEPGGDGLYAYPQFGAYFTGPDREAYLLRDPDSGKLLGFAMINSCVQNAPSGYSVAEFMVLPPYRRRGIGEAAALECFRKHPGRWEVSPSCGSGDAFRFWKRVIEGCTGRAAGFSGGIFTFSAFPR